MGHHSQRACFFPKLKTLRWNLMITSLIPYSLFFAHPGLLGLISGPADPLRQVQLLKAVTSRCTNLRNLCVGNISDGEREVNALALDELNDVVSSLVLALDGSLETLDCPDVHLSPAALRRLAISSSLRELDTETDLEENFDALIDAASEIESCIFGRIEILKGWVGPTKLSALLQSIGSASCHTLHMTSPWSIPGRIFSSVAQTLKVHASVKAFEDITLEYGFREYNLLAEEQEADYIITPRLLEPLFSLSKLQSLRVSNPFISVDDIFLREAGASLPDLEVFHLDCSDAPPPHLLEARSNVTIAGIAALLVVCSHIHELRMLVRASPAVGLEPPSTPVPITTPGASQDLDTSSNRREITLDFLHSRIQPEDVHPLVATFHATCPASASLKFCCWTESLDLQAAIDDADAMGMNEDGAFENEMTHRQRVWKQVEEGLRGLDHAQRE
jgi:hypothetical protein